jgi:hypothetical protein
MIFGKKKKIKKHKHRFKIVAINPDDLPNLPKLERIRHMRYWNRDYHTYHRCQCGFLGLYGGEKHTLDPPGYISARQSVLTIDKTLAESPQKAFEGLSNKVYSGVFTQEELNKSFSLLKKYLLMSRKFYMQYVGKWHPDKNTVKVAGEWADSYTTCSYCTSRYEGHSCPKCGAGRSE